MTDKPIINIDDLDYMDFGDGGKFECKMGIIAKTIGARDLGYNLTVVPPGKRAFPYHLHHKLEEMFFILEGEGKLRYNGKEHDLKKGDIIACPPGPDGAHQIINTGKAEMKFLAVSNSGGPEVAEYPDSGKVGIMCGTFEKPDLRLIVKNDSGIGYFDGESD